jgi:hypothetical protein
MPCAINVELCGQALGLVMHAAADITLAVLQVLMVNLYLVPDMLNKMINTNLFQAYLKLQHFVFNQKVHFGDYGGRIKELVGMKLIKENLNYIGVCP